MTRYLMVIAAAAGLMVAMTPNGADAYGAAHVGYTHVGPNGVYHVGETAAGGYGSGAARYGDVHTPYGNASYGAARGPNGAAAYDTVRTPNGTAAYGEARGPNGTAAYGAVRTPNGAAAYDVHTPYGGAPNGGAAYGGRVYAPGYNASYGYGYVR